MSENPKINDSRIPSPKGKELEAAEQDQIAGGIKGESTDKDHKDWIEVSSFKP
ncbi:MAG TPA: type VI secretion system tube protein Hcp [Bryobacteraceae bacterium]|nr:type VI secretion system tube protein Hcp [Bryobacteraceae bacterium]